MWRFLGGRSSKPIGEISKDRKELTIFAGVKEIESTEFAGTTIRSVTIPKSVEKIGFYVFKDCKQLKKVEFEAGSNLKRIGGCAFEGSAVESVTIPKSVEVIDAYAFADCKQLKTIKFEADSKLEYICDHVFDGVAVEEVTIPKSVKGMDYSAFKSKKLKNVTVEDGSELEKFSHAFDWYVVKILSIPKSSEEAAKKEVPSYAVGRIKVREGSVNREEPLKEKSLKTSVEKKKGSGCEVQ